MTRKQKEESIKDEEKTVIDSPKVETVAPLIYIGPNIPRLGINRYTVYKNGLPAQLNEPTIRSLFVKVEDLRKYENRINQPGTLENEAYKMALSLVRGEK